MCVAGSTYGGLGILGVSRTVGMEARGVLYVPPFPNSPLLSQRQKQRCCTDDVDNSFSTNTFALRPPSPELCPPPDFTVPLFPPGVARRLTRLCMRARAVYPLRWLLSGGHAELRRAYRGLRRLELVLEVADAGRGVGRMFGRGEGEAWGDYGELFFLAGVSLG